MAQPPPIILPPTLSDADLENMTVAQLITEMRTTSDCAKELLKAKGLMYKRNTLLINALHRRETSAPDWEALARAAFAALEEEVERRQRAAAALNEEESDVMKVRIFPYVCTRLIIFRSYEISERRCNLEIRKYLSALSLGIFSM
jgi:hypothetical protein